MYTCLIQNGFVLHSLVVTHQVQAATWAWEQAREPLLSLMLFAASNIREKAKSQVQQRMYSNRKTQRKKIFVVKRITAVFNEQALQ
jgi:hypothetical protein